MDEEEAAAFVCWVLTDAEEKLGPTADPVWLRDYAREAVFDLWLEEPAITVAIATELLDRLHEAIDRRRPPDRPKEGDQDLDLWTRVA